MSEIDTDTGTGTDTGRAGKWVSCSPYEMTRSSGERDGTHGAVKITDAVDELGLEHGDPVMVRFKKSDGTTFTVNRPLNRQGAISVPVKIREQYDLTRGDVVELKATHGVEGDYDGTVRRVGEDDDRDTSDPEPAEPTTQSGLQTDLSTAVASGSVDASTEVVQPTQSGPSFPDVEAVFDRSETNFHIRLNGVTATRILCGWTEPTTEDYVDGERPEEVLRYRDVCRECLQSFFEGYTSVLADFPDN